MRFFTRIGILVVVILTSSFFGSKSFAQEPCKCWGVYPLAHQRLVPGVNITPQLKGYSEVLPPGYNPNGTTRYPLILNFPGRGSRGDGTLAELCAIACEGMTLKIEQDIPTGSGDYRFQTSVVHNGQTYSYIILTPQFTWAQAETAADVQAFLNYALANYKVDPARVYLTGLSIGSNIVLNYMGTSPQEARKVAAVISVGLCQGSNGGAAFNMGTNRIRYWGLTGNNDTQCGTNNTINQSNQVNNNSPAGNPMGKYTVVNGTNTDPHIIWPDIHDKDWRIDGKNIAEWFIQYSSSSAGSLPATLIKYEVASKGTEVVTNWSTSVESNTSHFIIERAGPDLQFKPIGKLAAAGDATVTNTYSFSDRSPLKGTSYYRLSLMNKDGQQEYYDTKKIVSKQYGASIALTPVPATKTIQLSIELEAAQKIQFMIRDLNGRTVETFAASFSSGFANFPISIERLTSGIYYLSIQGNNFTESKKFIKQ